MSRPHSITVSSRFLEMARAPPPPLPPPVMHPPPPAPAVATHGRAPTPQRMEGRPVAGGRTAGAATAGAQPVLVLVAPRLWDRCVGAVRADTLMALLVVAMLAATMPAVAHHESRLWVAAYATVVCAAMLVLYRMLAVWFRLSMGTVLAVVGAWTLWVVHGAAFRAVEADSELVAGAAQALLFGGIVSLSYAPALHASGWHLFAANVLVAVSFPHRDAIAGDCEWPLALAKVYGFAVAFALAELVGAALVDRWHYAEAATDLEATPVAQRSAMRLGRALTQSMWILYAVRYALAAWLLQCACIGVLVARNRSAVGRAGFGALPRICEPDSMSTARPAPPRPGLGRLTHRRVPAAR